MKRFSYLRHDSKASSALFGIFAIVVIVSIISFSTFLYITDINQEAESLANIETDIISYSIDGEDLLVSFSFKNVSAAVSGHFEAHSMKITVENRSATGYLPVAVDLVSVSLGYGDITRNIVFDGLIQSDAPYCIGVSFITKSSIYNYKDIIIFEEKT